MSTLVKSKISLAEFKALWYYGEPIDPDDIEDGKLKDMYTSYLSISVDCDEAYEAIEEYIGGRSIIHEVNNAHANERADERRPELSH